MANVSRFRELMMTYPIAVLVEPCGGGERVALFAYSRRDHAGKLKYDHDFEAKNHGIMCEAADLFWGDDDVFTFITEHQGLEIGLTGARVRSIQPGQIRIPEKGEVKAWQPPTGPADSGEQVETEIDVETGEVKTTRQEEAKPVRAHQKTVEIKTKHLTLSF
jgi:hypothetical protein